MQAVHIKENQKEIWNRFIAENSSESFLQAWEWGEFNCALGRKAWRIGIIENGLFNEKETENTKYQIPNTKYILAAVLIVKYDLPLGRSYLYCPRMMISRKFIKSKVRKVNEVLFREIGKIAKKERAVFLRFDPAVEMEKKSPLPPFKKGGIIPPFLKGARGIFKKSPDEVQPKNTLILDLAKSEEELLKEMKSKTRYNIRLAMKKKLEIRKLGTPPNPPLARGGEMQNPLLAKEGKIQNSLLAKEGVGGGFEKDFEGFWNLMEETAARDNFRSHNKNYYWRMLENLGGVENPPLTPPKRGIKNPPSPLLQRGNSQEGNNLTARLYLAEFENKIIAANIVLFFGDYCVYLHGASSSEYRNLMVPYLLQWRQILDAKKMGCRRYDFWGISPTDKDAIKTSPDPSLVRRGKYKIPSLARRGENDWGGITRFKKGFGGEEVNYVGAYDLVFDKFWYGLYKIARQIKGNF